MDPFLAPTRVIAIRHGETAWNVDTRIQGQLDIELNPQGHEQARRLGDALADETIDVLYASDLSRARQTAEHLGRAIGQPVRLEAGLRERQFGVYQGLTVAEIQERWPEDATRWRAREPDFAPDGAESLQQFYQRCVGTALELAAQHPGQTVAMVAHGGVLDCLYRAATGVDLQAPRTWRVENASVNRLLFHGEGFTLIGWADVRHLEGAGFDEMSDQAGAAHDRAGPAA